MTRVHTLPESVIHHIAAGEVIERPVSVVKELVENSLDAQARTIKILIQGGGVELIQVDDDGIGMDAEDAVQCFTRHATSKITSLEDLQQLATLGFRGEALPSIATVSRLQLVSREAAAIGGTRVVLEGGKITAVETCGAPQGTSIQIRDLFFNTPARLKFLKHSSTETSHITQCITSLALVAPQVHISLHVNGRSHLQAPITAAFTDRLEALFGAGFAQHLLPVEAASAEIQVAGYIGKATFHRATRRQQFFFVNGRAVQNRSLSRALYEAYRTVLPRDRHPVACLFLTLPGGEVDVNVHPAKLEVRFRQESRLYDRLRRLLQECLQSSLASLPSPVEPLTARLDALPTSGFIARPQRPVPTMWRPPLVAPQPQSLRETWAAKTPGEAHCQPLSTHDTTPVLPLYAGYPEAGRTILEGHPIGQIHDTYLLMQYPGGMFLIDQHAAHERVLYERLRWQLQENKHAMQRLLFPATLELGATDPEWVAACLPRLEALGFALEHFGGQTYRLLSVPAVLATRDYAAACMDILEILRMPVTEEEALEEGLPRVFHRMLTTMACHGSVRARQRLQEEEIRALTSDLARTAMPFTCPHGRPVLLHIALAEIEKKFLRC